MARTFSTVSLEAEHVPETHRTLETDHTITEEDLPGMVNVYLVIDGARLLFTQYKAGKVFDALDLAGKQQAEATQATQASASEPTQPSESAPSEPAPSEPAQPPPPQ